MDVAIRAVNWIWGYYFFCGSPSLTKEGKKWLEKGLSALKEEMKVQVYPDGVNCEGSISYHRLVTELFLSTTLICIKNGLTFPQWYMTRLEKMIEFVMYLQSQMALRLSLAIMMMVGFIYTAITVIGIY